MRGGGSKTYVRFRGGVKRLHNFLGVGHFFDSHVLFRVRKKAAMRGNSDSDSDKQEH